MTRDDDGTPDDPRARLSALQAEQFDRMAASAEAIAHTAEVSARIHDGLIGQLPNAAAHAARDRRFAAAERAAAAAFREHELPSPDIRETIRCARPDPAARGCGDEAEAEAGP